MEEYGHSEEKSSSAELSAEVAEETGPVSLKDPATTPHMQAEERQTGTVSSAVYSTYLRYAGGLIWLPVFLIVVAAAQAAQGQY